ncbi:MAG: HupE/UreJ family protein [Chitinophagaceae bacterium]|nr:HupE/UreJ family protein [Chitinophagaceae bacterium]
MEEFWLYFDIGRKHIADWEGYDHILFVVALCLSYTFADWKKLLILITAFTIGHSITLAVSALNYMNVPTNWIEFLIPVTIIITALSNLRVKETTKPGRFSPIYFLALFFGLIHGLGFSNYLKALLGRDENIITQLLAFNLGLEAGQLLIVAGILLITFLCTRVLRMTRRDYVVLMSGAVFGISLIMAIERWPFRKEDRSREGKGSGQLQQKKTEKENTVVFNNQVNKLLFI